MKLYYSAKTGGFYDRLLHKTLPEGAVEISSQAHQALLKDNAQGARIEADAQGYPHAVFPAQDQLLAGAKKTALSGLTYLIRSQHQQAIGACDEIDILVSLHRYRVAVAIQKGTATSDEQDAFAKEIEARGLNESLESFCADARKRGAYIMTVLAIAEGLRHQAVKKINQAMTQAEVEACEQDFKSQLTVALTSLTEKV